MQKVNLVLLCLSVIFAETQGYFGLTGKGQLRDVWNLQSSSLAASVNDPDAWDASSTDPQPSTDYKPVNLGPKPLHPLHAKTTSGHSSGRDSSQDLDREAALNHRLNGANNNRNRNFNTNWGSAQQQTNHPARTRNTASQPGDRRPSAAQNQTAIANGSYKLLQAIALQRKERESGKKRTFPSSQSSYFLSQAFSRAQLTSGVSYTGNSGSHVISQLPVTSQNRSDAGIELTYTPRPFFGLDESELMTYSAYMNSKYNNLRPMVEPENINRKVARRWCDNFKLTTTQRKKCKRDSGLPQVLAEATQIAAAECQYQFRYERWNCSLGTSRIRLLDKGNKETAFLFAISSAGLTYSVARACSNGHLERCSCEERLGEERLSDASQEWMWGGCGDNVLYAAKFVRKFLKSRATSKDIRAEMDKHNSDLGIRIVKSNVKHPCKCHGVSGSCTTQSCWRKMAPFDVVGKKVKRAYDKAVKVGSVNNADGRTHLVRLRRSKLKPRQVAIRSRDQMISQHGRTRVAGNVRSRNLPKENLPVSAKKEPEEETIARPSGEDPKHKEMVFIEKSPSYCSKTRYSTGVKGRTCNKRKNCEKLCCNRGFTTHVRVIRKSCKCKVQWCCYVQCEVCTERKEVHTCK